MRAVETTMFGVEKTSSKWTKMRRSHEVQVRGTRPDVKLQNHKAEIKTIGTQRSFHTRYAIGRKKDEVKQGLLG
jgi:hypothetical protein